MEISKGIIGNALTSAASNHVVAVAHDIYDESKELYQDEINQNTDERFDEQDHHLSKNDDQIFDLINIFSCFGSGLWDNDAKWSNIVLWKNSNRICDTFDEAFKQIDSNRNSIKKINITIDEFRKEHDAFKQEHKEFANEHEEFRKEHEAFRKDHQEFNELVEQIHQTDNGQQHEIDALLYRSSLVNNGIWNNRLLWCNESEWSNFQSVGDGMACNCPGNTKELIEELQEGLEAANEGIQEHANHLSEIDEAISDNIKNIESNANAIEANSNAINATDENVDKLEQRHIQDNRQIQYQFRAIGREQNAQNDEIAELGEHFGLLSEGVWSNLFIWDNDQLWRNGAVVVSEELDKHNALLEKHETSINENAENILKNTEDIEANVQSIDENIKKISKNAENINANAENIDEANGRIDAANDQIDVLKQNRIQDNRQIQYQFRAIGREQAVQNDSIAELGEHFSVPLEGVWGNSFLWNDDLLWRNDTMAVVEEVDKNTAIIAQLKATVSEQQVTINLLQQQVLALLNCFTINNVGQWENALLWDNMSLWANEKLANAVGIGYMGAVQVQSYDEKTEAISI